MRTETLHQFSDTSCGRALAKCEADLGRLSEGEMADFLLDNFAEIADSAEAHELIRTVVLQ